jgi:ribonuclease J
LSQTRRKKAVQPANSERRVKSLLARHQIAEHHIHTSGHASPADLQKFAEALHPRKIVPIHRFMPEKYTALFANVEIHSDGERWKAK